MDADNNNPVKISIVIPFYNLENYVKECVESVLTQDMPDFEIIAVNDGSTDKTPALLEEYAAKDCRIKVIHLENGGISWARNNGAQRAQGEYLMFMDCDDFILPGCFSKLYGYAKSNNADVVIFNHAPYKNGVLGKARIHLYYKNEVMDAVTATRLRLLGREVYVWNKLIKRELYLEKNIHFEDGLIGEDIPVGCAMLINSKRVFYLTETFYANRIRAGSFSDAKRTNKRTHDILYTYKLIMAEVKKNGYENKLANAVDCGYIVALIVLLETCYSEPEKYKSFEELNADKIFLKKVFSEISLIRIIFEPNLKFSRKLKAIRLKSGVYKWEKAMTRNFRYLLKKFQ